MAESKEKISIPFQPLPLEMSDLACTLFQNALPSPVILPLSYIDIQTKRLKKQWLHEKELQKLSGFSFEKRYREWLGGRICSKKSLLLFLQQQTGTAFIPEHHQYLVASKESGRPFFTGFNRDDFTFPELSISHSKDFAAALSSNTYCGIDIQHPAENLYRVKERFLTKDEEKLLRESLPQLPTLQQLVLLWAGKEAIKKMCSVAGIPGFHELRLTKIIAHSKFTAALHIEKHTTDIISVAAGVLENGYGIALCCQSDSFNS